MSTMFRRAAEYLVSAEIWPVAILTAAGAVSSQLLPLALFVSLLFWPARWIVDKRLSVHTPADWGIAFLCLTIPITLWVTPVAEKTLPQVLRLASGILLYYALVNWTRTARRLRAVWLALTVVGLILALLAPAIVEWVVKLPLLSLSFFQHFTVLVTDPANPNVYAGTLVILLPLALAGVLFGEGSVSIVKWVGRLAIPGIMIVVIAMSQSRGAWLAFAMALLGMVLMRWRRGWLALPLVGIGLIGLLAYFGPDRLVGFVLSNNTLDGTEGRLKVWGYGISLVQLFPFTGIGLGAFSDVVRGIFPFAKDIYLRVPHVHNLFLQIAVDLGLPGMIAWLIILVTMAVTSSRLYCHGRTSQNTWISGLGAGLVCSQIALVVHGLTDSVTWGMVRPAPFVWALWGLIIACSKIYDGYPLSQGIRS